jgi:UDP-galactopyranose mutase
MSQAHDLIVFSHLRWDSVFQRPQHLMSRLCLKHRVFFIEEPILDPGTEGHWNVVRPIPNVFVCQPHTPVAQAGFCFEQIKLLDTLIKELVRTYRLTSHVAWFYTPMAMPLLRSVSPDVVVYDCMDALDSFLNAPTELKKLEEDLLVNADLVFTGGPSLYRRMAGRHDSAHCFPSSVDAAHFAKAKSIAEPSDQVSLLKPRLGFFGVIDERCDLQLLDTLATAHPDWQILMIGPVAKIPEDSLPRHANLHYLGKRSYEQLPAYAAGWDVCLMPFALNEATKHISPTKVLEYMAMEKPIVSTRITDVAEPYGHIVSIADTADGFVAACEAALKESAADRAGRCSMMRSIVDSTSWDYTVTCMSDLIEECRHSKMHVGAEARRKTPRTCSDKASDGIMPAGKQSHEPVPAIVVGAGPTGLSAAYHLGDDALLLEQNEEIGGWCRSIERDGFTFDFAGHIMFSNDPYVHEMYKMLLGDNVHWQDREAWIYSKNVHTRYPFQGALYGLPPEVITECIMGAIEARFGKVPDTQARSNDDGSAEKKCSHTTNGRVISPHANGSAKNGQINDCCGDGILESTAALMNGSHVADGQSSEPKNFEEFIYKVWGAGIAKHFAIPYNKKLWAVPLAEMETSWLGGRVPMPDLKEMIEGALRPVGKPMGPNARFGYPLRGGFSALMNGFLPHLKRPPQLNTGVAAVLPRQHLVKLRDGTTIPYEYLISTMPLPALIRAIGEQAPPSIREAVSKLRHVSVRCVHIGVGRENVTDKHWIYYPEETVFHRIFVQGNASPYCNPPGGFGLTCEITYSEQKPLPCDGDALIERAVADCRSVGIIGKDDPIWTATQCDLPYAYVVYDHARAKHVQAIRKWLEDHDIILAGRYSEWEYYNSDHAFIAGKKAAEAVLKLRQAKPSRGESASPVRVPDSYSLSFEQSAQSI